MTPTKTRLHRSELAVPASNVRMLEKAPSLGADVVMLDLEDAVAPDDKEQARINLVDALREQDWSRCSVSVRINGLDTHWCYRDIVDVVVGRDRTLLSDERSHQVRGFERRERFEIAHLRPNQFPVSIDQADQVQTRVRE